MARRLQDESKAPPNMPLSVRLPLYALLALCAFARLAAAVAPQQSTAGYFEPALQILGGAGRQLGYGLDGGRHLDFDGIPDFIAADYLSIHAYSGRSGSLLFTIQTGGSAAIAPILLLGDTNGDGVSEILFTSPSTREALVYSGAGGALLYTISGQTSVFGCAAAVVGDMTGDGVAEFLLSDPYAIHLGQSGMSFIHSGADGSLVRSHPIKDYWSSNLSGRRVARAGDVDRDGTPDYLIGAPLDALSRGTCTIFSGASGLTIRVLQNPNPSEDWFGTTVAYAGDCDGDGIPDQAVVTPYAYGNLPLISVFAGADGSLLWEAGANRWYGFGSNILAGFDWDNDGFEDLVTGEPTFLTAEGRNGALHLLSGRDGSILASRYGELAGDQYASRLAWFGDADGDGRPDIGVSSHSFDDPILGVDCGRVQSFDWYPGLRADADRISARQGGTVRFQIDLPDSMAGESYVLLASASGAGPTTFRGVSIPLSVDPFLLRTASSSLLFLHGSTGHLDARGNALPNLTLPPSVTSNRIGASLWFAAVAGPRAAPICSTTSKTITILP